MLLCRHLVTIDVKKDWYKFSLIDSRSRLARSKLGFNCKCKTQIKICCYLKITIVIRYTMVLYLPVDKIEYRFMNLSFIVGPVLWVHIPMRKFCLTGIFGNVVPFLFLGLEKANELSSCFNTKKNVHRAIAKPLSVT